MSKPEDSLLAAAHGLQRGESVSAFQARMEALAQLEAAIRSGALSGPEAASRLHELMLPDIEPSDAEAADDADALDYLHA